MIYGLMDQAFDLAYLSNKKEKERLTKGLGRSTGWVTCRARGGRGIRINGRRGIRVSGGSHLGHGTTRVDGLRRKGDKRGGGGGGSGTFMTGGVMIRGFRVALSKGRIICGAMGGGGGGIGGGA